MPNLTRSPPLNKSISLSETDMDKITQFSAPLEDVINITQRDNKRRRVADECMDSVSTDLRTIVREELLKLIAPLQLQQSESQNCTLQEIKEIKETNKHIQNSMDFLVEQNKEYRTKINELEVESKKNRDYINILESKLEDAQISYRKTNFELKNVPKLKLETKQDLVEIVTNLSKTVDCAISKNDIKDIYRVRGNNPEKKNTPIVVETNSAILKAEFLKKVKSFNMQRQNKLCAKHLGFKTQEDTPIFVSEHLTAKGTRLHFLARDLTKSKGYKFCWTAYGRVFVRKDENSPIINIKTEEQIQRLFQDI
ncbi:kinesin-related protein 9-like [Plodia interpunctella]|uniref:kinesin-related protein 9-like n=1 Tax=Plodia interpunctella TaxID=58824 RepID=UPI002367E21B|nr:kinesin-related protein 9-like [Plodia interpunctella]XP_053618940.1 kinesin-related protein 9-like [Plodia interpunctella]